MQHVPSSFWLWISTLKSDDLTGLLVFAGFVCIAGIGAICITVCTIHKNRTEDALKRELLDRGMSADEIATIVGAKSSKGPWRQLLRPMSCREK